MLGGLLMVVDVIRDVTIAYDRSPFSPAGLAEMVSRRLHERRRALAAGDAEWVAIEDRKEPDGSVVLSADLTFDDLKRQRAIEERLLPTPVLDGWLQRLRRVSATTAVTRVETAWARARRGWAPADTWSMDVHLCDIVAGMLLHLADNAHGWPGSPEFETPQEWDTALRSTAVALGAYADAHDTGDDADDETVLAEAKQAMHWVAENLPSLWD